MSRIQRYIMGGCATFFFVALTFLIVRYKAIAAFMVAYAGSGEKIFVGGIEYGAGLVILAFMIIISLLHAVKKTSHSKSEEQKENRRSL